MVTFLTHAAYLFILSTFWKLSCANLDCYTYNSNLTETTSDAKASIACPAEHPTLVSCGCITTGGGDPREENSDGCYIDNSILNGGIPRCVAQNGNGGSGIRASARCCNFPANTVTDCSYSYVRSTGDNAAKSKSCSSGQLMGCGLYSPFSSQDGSYPGTISPADQTLRNTDVPVSGYFNGECTAVDGGGGFTDAQLTCCESNVPLNCKLVYSQPSTGYSIPSECSAGYTLVACSGWGDSKNLVYVY